MLSSLNFSLRSTALPVGSRTPSGDAEQRIMSGAANPLNALLFSNMIILPLSHWSEIAALVPKCYFLEAE